MLSDFPNSICDLRDESLDGHLLTYNPGDTLRAIFIVQRCSACSHLYTKRHEQSQEVHPDSGYEKKIVVSKK